MTKYRSELSALQRRRMDRAIELFKEWQTTGEPEKRSQACKIMRNTL